MKFQIVCAFCGAINYNDVPLVSKENGMSMTCWSCHKNIIRFTNEDVASK
jgi:hypothetical protein